MFRSALRAKSALLALTAAVALATAPAQAASRDFVGNWVNTNHNTRGLTRLVISGRGPGALHVRGFGQCHPRDCDWGTTRLNLFSPSVNVPLRRGARRGLAHFPAGFKRTTVTLALVNAGTIRFCTFNNFTDRSGRSDYYNCGTLIKRRGGFGRRPHERDHRRGHVRDHRR